jgi:hypothetical protein
MAEDGDIIYHYTSVEAFWGIISSNKLWLSNISDTNDRTEYRHFNNKCLKAIKNKEGETAELIKNLKEFNGFFSNKTYMCSFSSKKDLLSQWRGYGKMGHGVSIGFRISKLDIKKHSPTPSHHLADCLGIHAVNYDKADQDIMVINLLSRYSLAYSGDYDGDTYEQHNYAALNLGIEINKISAICKHHAFIEENEVRIIYTPLGHGMMKVSENSPELSYRIVHNKVRKYYKWIIPSSAIAIVIRGSNCDLSKKEIQTCFTNAKIDPSGIKIRSSDCPFRG